MGLSFRRSLKMGPLRLNASSSGLSVSSGIRGARVSVGPKGTYVTLSAMGFQYRKKLADAPRKKAKSTIAEPKPRLPPEIDEQEPLEGEISTASVEELQALSSSDFVRELDSAWRKSAMLPAYLAVALTLFVSVAYFAVQSNLNVGYSLFIGSQVLVAIGCIAVAYWDAERLGHNVIYDIDNEALLEQYAAADNIGECLRSSSRLWHISSHQFTDNYKYNAGASQLFTRTKVKCTRGSLPRIDLNILPWSIPAGPQRLLFLPDLMIVIERGRLVGVPYSLCQAGATHTQMIENEPPPGDSRQVGKTWRFVNKDGSRDRRFKHNPILPIMEYGLLTIESDLGIRLVFQLSNPQHAHQASEAFNRLSKISARNEGKPVPKAKPETPERNKDASAETNLIPERALPTDQQRYPRRKRR